MSSDETHDSAAVENVRRLSGVGPEHGPSDSQLLSAVAGFVDAFDYWYVRVMREAVPAYRTLIVRRINPFVRRIECDGMDAAETAQRLVQDYNSRNFVTAGGWAIEALATSGRPEVRKSGITGIDLERFDESAGEYHLYVLKSGTVTRNSDIVSALKRNSRVAERQLRQARTTQGVRANYAVAAGRTTSTFEDGVWRPSSGEFWGEMFGLPEHHAVELALAIAAEAGRQLHQDASAHVDALKLVVANYIASRVDQSVVDWDFIARRNMQQKASWIAHDKERHRLAVAALARSGYVIER